MLLDKESLFDNNFIARQNSVFMFPYGKILHFKRYKSSCVLYLCLPRAVMWQANRYLLVSAIIYAHTMPQFFFIFLAESEIIYTECDPEEKTST